MPVYSVSAYNTLVSVCVVLSVSAYGILQSLCVYIILLCNSVFAAALSLFYFYLLRLLVIVRFTQRPWLHSRITCRTICCQLLACSAPGV